MIETILKDLKERFGKKVILSPEDVAPIIATSPAVQANLRSQGRFPIPITKIGRKIGISIYHLAEFLATGNVEVEAPEIKTRSLKVQPEAAMPRRASGRSRDWLLAFQMQNEYQFELAKCVQRIFLKAEIGSQSSREIKAKGKI